MRQMAMFAHSSGESAGTAKAIFEVMDANQEISWLNCVGIYIDNTSVNVGKHNSIMSRAEKETGISIPWDAHVTYFTILLKKLEVYFQRYNAVIHPYS